MKSTNFQFETDELQATGVSSLVGLTNISNHWTQMFSMLPAQNRLDHLEILFSIEWSIIFNVDKTVCSCVKEGIAFLTLVKDMYIIPL